MPYYGVTGKLCLGTALANEVTYISNWSIEESRDIIEITKLGSNSKEKLAAAYSWSASADGSADFTNANGQMALRTAMGKGESVNVVFYLESIEGQTPLLSKYKCLIGVAYIESMSVDISAEDKANISISLKGFGRLKMLNAVPTSTDFQTLNNNLD